VWFVDDGSRDATAQVIEQAHRADARIKLVQFSRNFGPPRPSPLGSTVPRATPSS